jgi:hypothetical protein
LMAMLMAHRPRGAGAGPHGPRVTSQRMDPLTELHTWVWEHSAVLSPPLNAPSSPTPGHSRAAGLHNPRLSYSGGASEEPLDRGTTRRLMEGTWALQLLLGLLLKLSRMPPPRMVRASEPRLMCPRRFDAPTAQGVAIWVAVIIVTLVGEALSGGRECSRARQRIAAFRDRGPGNCFGGYGSSHAWPRRHLRCKPYGSNNSSGATSGQGRVRAWASPFEPSGRCLRLESGARNASGQQKRIGMHAEGVVAGGPPTGCSGARGLEAASLPSALEISNWRICSSGLRPWVARLARPLVQA